MCQKSIFLRTQNFCILSYILLNNQQQNTNRHTHTHKELSHNHSSSSSSYRFPISFNSLSTRVQYNTLTSKKKTKTADGSLAEFRHTSTQKVKSIYRFSWRKFPSLLSSTLSPFSKVPADVARPTFHFAFIHVLLLLPPPPLYDTRRQTPGRRARDESESHYLFAAVVVACCHWPTIWFSCCRHSSFVKEENAIFR